jgi:flagellar hook-associated protein 1 FlgK
MSVGLNSIFDIGRKALKANLNALDVTGNNIANVNTEGYSRERINLKPSLPIKTPNGIYGTGVDVESVRRVRDRIVDRQIRTNNSPLGEFSQKEKIYKQIENIFNEPSAETGIRQQLQSFFDSFSELANDPESSSSRTVLQKQAEVLVETIKRIDDQLRVLSNDVGFETEQKIKEINDIAQKIADLNIKIATLENAGGYANQLRDERDLELDKLSQMTSVYYAEESSGAINVSIGSNSIVSDGERVSTLKTIEQKDGENLLSKVIGAESGLEFSPNGGELKALIELRNEIIPKYREELDSLAKTLISQVNSIHRNGVGLKGSEQEIPHDNNFFTGTGVSDIDLSNAIKENVNNIAAAERIESIDESGQTVISGAPGDNKIALQIANLKGTLVFNSNTETFDDYLSKVIGTLGVESSDAKNNATRQNMVVTQFKNLRDSTSGVSLDEELTYLIKYQRGYQAAARVISTVDDMYLTLINM